MIEYHVKGLDELIGNFAEAHKIFGEEVAVGMQAAVQQYGSAIKATAPFGFREPHIRSDIDGEVIVGNRITGIVHVRPYWASWVDKGTKPHEIKIGNKTIHHPGAKPAHFIREATRVVRADVRQDFEDAAVKIARRLDTETDYTN